MRVIKVALGARRRQIAAGQIDTMPVGVEKPLDEPLGAQVNVDPIRVNLDVRDEGAQDRPRCVVLLCVESPDNLRRRIGCPLLRRRVPLLWGQGVDQRDWIGDERSQTLNDKTFEIGGWNALARRLTVGFIASLSGDEMPRHIVPVANASWLMSIPRSARRSSTLRRDSGYLTYIITTRRMTSGELLKYRNGLLMA